MESNGALPFANYVTWTALCVCQPVWALSVKGLRGHLQDPVRLRVEGSVWDLAWVDAWSSSFYSRLPLKAPGQSACFPVTEMLFHGLLPIVFCLTLPAAPLESQFHLQNWPFSFGKSFLKSNHCQLPLPRPGLFPSSPASGALREWGGAGLYGNSEKRMPSLLICIQTVSFTYRRVSSA